MKLPTFLALLLGVACSASSATTTSDPDNGIVVQNGTLTLALSDFPTQLGILWALPSVQTSARSVVVSSTNYGSLCQYAVSGSTSLVGNRLTLDITFVERLTSCVAGARALSYSAEISGLSGSYDLYVVHHQNFRADTLVHRAVDIR